MKLTHCLFVLLCLLCRTVAGAQEFRVTGSVTSKSSGAPLAGVSISVKEGKLLGITDEKGAFAITAPGKGSWLVFDFAGMEVQTVAADKSVLAISLSEKAGSLDEIVVVGYGTQKKSVVTGSISKVKASDLESMPVVRLEQSLQGRTSGITIVSNSGQPGDAATIRIRGTTTINGNDPLYIVDGMQIAGGIDYLSQDDVESIEVLKDAASGAIYGARAANGVIIVTTKKGRKRDMRTSYNGYYGIQQPWRKVKMLNGVQYATLMNEASVADGGSVLFTNPQQYGKGTNWQDELYSNSAPIQNHNLSISGGSDKSTYFTSLGYLDQKGIVYPDVSQYKRWSARFNAIHEVSSAIKIGTNVGYTHVMSRGVVGGTNNEFGSSLNRALNIDPITPVVVTDPAVLATPPYSNQPNIVRDADGRPFGISPYVAQEIVNPIAVLSIQQGSNWSDKIVSNIYAEIEPITGLKLKTSIGADLAFWGSDGFTPKYYLNASVRVDSTNAYFRNKNRGLNYIWENTASYKRSIAGHNFTILAGMSAQRNTGENDNGTIQGLPVNNLKDAALAWAGTVGPNYQFFSGSEYQDRLVSYFGRLTYDYKEKYLLTAILRADGSTKFGPDNRFGYFPSASVGWVATREDFWSKRMRDAISFLKIRASYGINGNNQLPDFSYLSTIGSGARYYTIGTNQSLVPGSSPNALSNPALKWEEVKQTDIGFDAVFLQSFNVSFDWFNKKTSGMLLAVDVPTYVGNGGPQDNVGDMSNKGWELELGYNKKVGDFDISVSANTSYIQNKVTFLSKDKTFLEGQAFGPQGLKITRTSVGESYGYLFGFKTAGLFQTQAEIDNYVNKDGGKLQPNAKPGDIKFVDFSNNGKIDDVDRTRLGSALPTWTFGITASVKWHNLDIVAFGQGVGGNKVYNITRRYDLPMANWSADALGRWTGPGTSNYFPRLTMADPNGNLTRSSDFFIQDGAYFRVKVLQLGYSFSNGLIDRVGLKKLRVYVTGNNLVTLTKYRGSDPEISGGVDRGIYPQARSYMAGVSLTF
jgi:TonB-linked SusC/RagA family outer membrane protein